MWLRIYGKYGSEGWNCKNFDKKDDHVVIGKNILIEVVKKK